MNDLNKAIDNYISQNSGFDTKRVYLGMSSVGDCQRKQVQAFLNGMVPDMKTHRMAMRGYRMEKIANEILIGSGIMKPDSQRVLYAPFDKRLEGHTDGESVNGELIEIKSKIQRKFDEIVATGRLTSREFNQIQCYMKYGDYKEAIVFIICPESFDTYTLRMHAYKHIQDRIEEKALRVLEFIDKKVLPPCECGRCK